MSASFSDLEIPPSACPPQPMPCLRANLSIPMRDGTPLVGDLYVPEGEGTWPVIVERTPYGAAALGPLGACYAAQGYLFLAVDVRGRYRSAGQWDPLANEKCDGPDVLQWAAALAECDGRVGTRGHSYAGVNQLLAAPHAGPCLKAMVAYVAPGDPFDNVPYQGGAYDLSDYEWAWFQTGPTCQPDETAPEWDRRFRDAFAARPLIDADLRLGLRNPFIRQWLEHWRLDEFWTARSWLPDLNRMRVPTLHISGWWDNNGRGSVLAYRAMGGCAGGQRLLLGPWEHSLTPPALDDLPEFEQSLIHRAALRDAFTDELAWFDAHLKDQKQSLPAAEIFVTGAWRWMEASDWPPPGVAAQSWSLTADGGLQIEPGGNATNPPLPLDEGVFNQTSHPLPKGAGSTQANLDSNLAGQRQYTFDPANPNSITNAEFPVNLAPYNTTPDVRDDVLVYRSQPLAGRILVLGDVVLELEAATTARDVDWVARLVDEYPDGRSICIRDGILRARFREGFDRPRAVTPGDRLMYAIDLWHVGHLFRVGHRLRVEVCSSTFGRWDVNPGDGGDLATSQAAIRSVQTIFHGGGAGSRLLLPQCDARATAEYLWDI
jgi:uncharacterized protein